MGYPGQSTSRRREFGDLNGFPFRDRLAIMRSIRLAGQSRAFFARDRDLDSRSRWDQDVPSSLGCTRPTLRQETHWRSFRARFKTGSPRPFPVVQPPPRGWPGRPIAAGENVLLVSPTGTGKTLAGFLAILDRLFRAHRGGNAGDGLRCVYISPLRSLGYDIERNLSVPLEGISGGSSWPQAR